MAYSDIKDPSKYFQTTIYTGNNTANHAITNDGNSSLQPDLLWIKSRDAAHSHWLVDSNRGVTKGLFVEGTDIEKTSLATRDVASFDTDGFTVGVPYHSSSTNSNSSTKVAWQWKANGGTTSSNTDGSVTSTVQANTTAGFSIVTYGGTASAATVGHGLADTPDVIIFKNRDDTNVWAVYHQSLGNNVKIVLSGNDAQDADGAFMNGTLPTSSVFTVGASVNTNGSGDNYVAYCFAEKQGYSKFSSYIGNGESLNGPFVYTGFKPAWVMVKNADNVNGRNWYIYDNTRSTYNPNGTVMRADTDGTEITDQAIDILSNGFKVKPSAIGSYGTSNINNASEEIIYMAFAESPFVAGGVPTTAR